MLTGIGVRHLGREVSIASEQVGECVAPIVAWDEDIHDSLGQRLDVGDEARTTFVEYEDDGLTSLGEFLHELTLVLGEPEVCEVAWCLGIRVLTDGCDDDISLSSCCYSLVNLWFILIVVGTVFIIGHTLFEDDVLLAVFVAECFVDGVVFLREVFGLRTLPSVAPATVQTAHLVGIRTREQDFLSLGEWQDAVVLQQHL